MSPARTSAPAMSSFRGGATARLAQVPPPPPFPWPTQQTTGYVNAPGFPGVLTPFSSTITSNTTYSYRSFSPQVSIGTAGTPVSNVTFYGCDFTGTGGVGNMACLMFTNGPVTFSFCSFEPQGVAEPGPPGGVTLAQSYQYGICAQGAFGTSMAQATVDHCDFWGFGNGAIGAGGGTQAAPHIYRYNYIHDMCLDATYHGDGIGFPGGGTESYTVIDWNNIQALGNTQALAYQNSPGPATWDHFTITNNLFGGFGYTICIAGGTAGSPVDATSITFIGNTYSTLLPTSFGPLYPVTFWTGGGSLWRLNRWHVPSGAAWGHYQYDGYYWIPGTISNASSNPDELTSGLVSLTDYTG